MFGHDDDRVDSHDDIAIGPAMSVPDVPPLRIWDVTLRQGNWTETRVVKAHEIEMSPDCAIVRWREFYKDEQGMPGNMVILTIVKPIDGWVEYAERKPEPVSKLVLVGGGSSPIY